MLSLREFWGGGSRLSCTTREENRRWSGRQHVCWPSVGCPHSIWRHNPLIPAGQRVNDSYQYLLLLQAVPGRPVFTDASVKQKDTLLTFTSLCLKESVGDETEPEMYKAKASVSGGYCSCSTDGEGYLTLQSHYSCAAGGLNKCVCVCVCRRSTLCCQSRCSSLYTVKAPS